MVTTLLKGKFLRKDFESHSVYRKAIEVHLKGVLYTKTVINTETGIEISFNKSGIEKCVSQIGDIKACALCNLKIILENARLFEEQKDKRGRPEFSKILLFKTKSEIEKAIYEVWIYVRETPNGHYMYSLNVNNEKTL